MKNDNFSSSECWSIQRARKKIAICNEKFSPLSLKLKPENLVGEHQLMVTQTQLNAINKAKSEGKGCVLTFSQNQIKKNRRKSFFPYSNTCKSSSFNSSKSTWVGRTFFRSRKSFEKDLWKWWNSPGSC